MLRKLLDKVEPLFHKGGKLEKLYPLYEANDTFLYTPGEVTHGQTQVRDAIDLKRMMSMDSLGGPRRPPPDLSCPPWKAL